jgi:hypothetical protein
MLVSVAAVALALSAITGMNEWDRRSELCHKEVEYHRWMEQKSKMKAAEWEALASDPSQEADLPLALFKAGRWSRGQILEIGLESSPSRPRWKQVSSEAKEIAREQARAYRRVSEYHARQRRRYDRAAFSPWLAMEPDQPPPEP